MADQKPAFNLGPARLAALWDSLRESFWLVPGLMAFGSLLLGLLFVGFDDFIEVERHESLRWLVTSAGTARVTLSALGGAMITVAGVTFSVTMVTLTLTSSQFGSRLLRTFLNNNVTQFTLGAFLATSLYCMVVLRFVRDTERVNDVPHLAVTVAFVMAVFSLVAFVYFVHHVVAAIQAQNVARAVFRDLRDAVDRLFPDELDAEEESSEAVEDAEERLAEHCEVDDGVAAWELKSDEDGYLQAIEVEEVRRIANAEKLRISLLFRPGQFISCGEPIALIAPREHSTEEVAESIRVCFVVGSRRTPRQDIECAIVELVEVAVRALSPGINDPVTAMGCVDYLGAALSRMARRHIPPRYHCNDDGKVCLTTTAVTFADALNTAFDPIRQYARDSAGVTIRLLEALASIARQIRRDDDGAAVLRQAEMIMRSATRFLPEENDQHDVRERLERVQSLVEASSSNR